MHADRVSAPVPTTASSPVADALRAVEAILLRGGQQTARRNAWAAVCEDRRRARDRREAQTVLDSAPPFIKR
nr:hypothetical protein [Wenjunlia tyrosinilytica]